jgi:hypothetical protein
MAVTRRKSSDNFSTSTPLAAHSSAASPAYNSLRRLDPNQPARPWHSNPHSACRTALRSLARGFLPWRLSDAGRRTRGAVTHAAGIRNPSHERPKGDFHIESAPGPNCGHLSARPTRRFRRMILLAAAGTALLDEWHRASIRVVKASTKSSAVNDRPNPLNFLPMQISSSRYLFPSIVNYQRHLVPDVEKVGILPRL